MKKIDLYFTRIVDSKKEISGLSKKATKGDISAKLDIVNLNLEVIFEYLKLLIKK